MPTHFSVRMCGGHGRVIPPAGQIPGTPYSITEEDGKRRFILTDNPSSGGAN